MARADASARPSRGRLVATLARLTMRYRRALIVGVHVLLVPVAYASAFLLRFDGVVPPAEVAILWRTLPALLLLRLACFAAYRLYSGWWRHVGMFDLQALVKATTLSSVLFVCFLVATSQVHGFPRSIVLLDWGVSLLLFGGIRFSFRWVREGSRRRAATEEKGKRALIIGAGDAAARLLRQLREHQGAGLIPVGLVDDAPNKQGIQLHGVPVLGRTRDLERLVKQHRISLLVLAIPTASREDKRRIAESCAGLQVELKVVPTLDELIDGRAHLMELRTVQPEDLLGRSPVNLDLARVQSDLRDRVVMITGAAGSIGSELARQVARFGPARLVLVEQAESPLYFVDFELEHAYPELEIVCALGDVTDGERMEELFSLHRPDYVFHAAAYKHVPMMEGNVTEAVRNNVFGTWRVAECAARYGARKFALVSTDKAVRPSSVMGATKRIAERLVLAMPELWRTRTDFRAVRFGNVLGSEGSVIPLFRRQIAAGGPITVTHPDVTRYFMTIPESVQLVLQAAALPEAARRISMLDMGEPVRILEMAENLIRLSGLRPYEEMPIVFTGMRPGEKLHEELSSPVEATVPTAVDKIRVLQAAGAESPSIVDGLARLQAAVDARDEERTILAIVELVPECVPPLRRRATEAAATLALRPGRLAAVSAADGGADGDDPRPLSGKAARIGPVRALEARQGTAES